MEWVAVATAVASAGLNIAGDVQGYGQDKFALETKEREARIQADQSDAAASADLRRQIGNIKAIRASAGGSVDTPTLQAILAEERFVAGENRRKVRAGFESTALQAKADRGLAARGAYLSIAKHAVRGARTIAASTP
ncbi:MAG: hypothetical protein ACREIB_10115 [Pseudomonadota bacterium]